MNIAKKLAFAPIFLILLTLTLFFSVAIINNTDLLFSLNWNGVIDLGIISLLIIFTATSFIVFTSLAQDWKYVLPISLLGAATSFFFFSGNISYILATGLFLAFSLIYFLIERGLKTYLTFQPTILFSPSIRLLISLIIFVLAITFYLTSQREIKENGFAIPESLIEFSMRFSPTENLDESDREVVSKKIDPEEIEFLKQNPALLKQFNIDPKVLENAQVLETIRNPKFQPPVELYKKLLEAQFQKIIEPYLIWIPIFLAFLFYFTLSFISGILALVIYPLLWFIYYSLEKSGFIRFETEMREVKKMVV